MLCILKYYPFYGYSRQPTFKMLHVLTHPGETVDCNETCTLNIEE